jgi:parallel beta-helix repeat protein
MKTVKPALLVALFSILALYFALAVACGDDDDGDGNDSDGGSDVCADFCEIIAHCDMGEDLDIYTMDECLDFCLQVGSVGNCVMAAEDCDEATACFEEEGDTDTEDTCTEGEIWDDELGECIPSECGLNRYPEAPFDDKALLYVDASYTGGSDGSMDSPFKTVTEAIATAGEDTSILIAAGDYVATETLTIDKDGLDLVARCPYLTKARSAESDTVLLMDHSDSNLIKRIAFYAEGTGNEETAIIDLRRTSETMFSENSITDSTGIGFQALSCNGILISNNVFKSNADSGIVFGQGSGTISGNQIYDNFGFGIAVANSEQVLVSDNIVEGNIDAGIFYNEASGTISWNEARDNYGRGINVQTSEGVSISDNVVEGNPESGITLINSSGNISRNNVRDNFVAGIQVQGSEQISVSDNIVEGNTEGGIFFKRASGTISGNTVVDTRPNGQGNFGIGIGVQDSEGVSVSVNVVEGNTEAGIAFGDSSGTISGNEVRDTRPNEQGKFGRGINVRDSEQISVSDNIVEGNTEIGIFFGYASGTILGNEVRDTSPDGQGKAGCGISVQDSEQVSVSDNILENNTSAGIYFDSTSGTISGNEVRDTLASAPYEDGYTAGHGIHVQVSTNVECSLNIVENNVHAGIFYILSENGNIFDNYVSGTLAGARDYTDRGDGIIVLGIEGFISIQDNTLEDNDRCGVLADSSNGMIERNGIFGNENSVVSQNDSVMDVSDNDIHDNDIDIVQFFEGRELSVSDSMIERNGMMEEM